MFFRRKAILLIHGFVGGIYDFDTLPSDLELIRNYDVYTFTLPSHEKFVVNNVKYEEWIQASEKQVETLINNGYKKIYLIGHSMGGVIATHLAGKYKEVKKLVLAAPAFRYFYFKDGKVTLKGFNETVRNMPLLFKDEGREKVIQRIRKTPLSTMMEFTKLVAKYQDDTNKGTCPSLTIHGLDDRVVPKEGTEHVYNTILSKTNILVNIKEVPHDCFIKKRNDEVKKIIINFLRKTPHNKKEIINM